MERLDPGNENHCQRVAISGLRGIGKTQLALEVAFQIKEELSDYSVFWVPASNAASFERAYREIGQSLRIPGIDDKKIDIKLLVKEFLCHEDVGRWLMVIDNADDVGMLFSQAGKNDESSGHLGQADCLSSGQRDENDESLSSFKLEDYLPFSQKGSILFTTRNLKIAVKYAGNNFIKVEEIASPNLVSF
jgi:hypothetical protein